MKSKTIKPLPVPLPEPILRDSKNNPQGAAAVAKRLLLFVVALAASGSLCFAVNDGQMRFENYLFAQISEPIAQMTYVVAAKPVKQDFDLDAKAALSLRIGATGREKVILKKNSADVLPIASLTKLMTATVVSENPDLYGLDIQVVISPAAASRDDVPVSGNLMAGESYSVRQLLADMLFYSSNDAAYALSEVMGANEFVGAMNSKARELGLANTFFYNPNGLDMDDGTANHSSAADLMVLVKYILQKHPEIFSFTVQPGQSLTENGIFNIKLWDGQTLIGGKTGYTQKAGGCMILVIENDKQRRYIDILIGSASSETRVGEMQKLVNFANNSDN